MSVHLLIISYLFSFQIFATTSLIFPLLMIYFPFHWEDRKKQKGTSTRFHHRIYWRARSRSQVLRPALDHVSLLLSESNSFSLRTGAHPWPSHKLCLWNFHPPLSSTLLSCYIIPNSNLIHGSISYLKNKSHLLVLGLACKELDSCHSVLTTSK